MGASSGLVRFLFRLFSDFIVLKGAGDDSAHPPIHPTRPGDGLVGTWTGRPLDRVSLIGDEKRIYEFVARYLLALRLCDVPLHRHFLACCSHDGKDGITVTPIFILDSQGSRHQSGS
jgi:hypothetical protein